MRHSVQECREGFFTLVIAESIDVNDNSRKRIINPKEMLHGSLVLIFKIIEEENFP